MPNNKSNLRATFTSDISIQINAHTLYLKYSNSYTELTGSWKLMFQTHSGFYYKVWDGFFLRRLNNTVISR